MQRMEVKQMDAILGPQYQCMALEIVKMYSALPIRDVTVPNTWKFMGWIGYLCLVFDLSRRGFYFQLYDLNDMNIMYWEHELYYDMPYMVQTPQHHTIEIEDQLIGFSFTRPAHQFANQVLSFTPKLKPTSILPSRIDTSVTLTPPTKSLAQKTIQMTRKVARMVTDAIIDSPSRISPTNSTSATSNSTHPIRIGSPTNVTHDAHVGWSDSQGYILSDHLPPEWRRILRLAGIRKRDLSDPATFSKVVETVKGYRNSLKHTLSSNTPPPLPPRRSRPSAPPLPPSGDAPSPPLVATTNTNAHGTAPAPLLTEIQSFKKTNLASVAASEGLPDVTVFSTHQEQDLCRLLRNTLISRRQAHSDSEDSEEEDWSD